MSAIRACPNCGCRARRRVVGPCEAEYQLREVAELLDEVERLGGDAPHRAVSVPARVRVLLDSMRYPGRIAT